MSRVEENNINIAEALRQIESGEATVEGNICGWLMDISRSLAVIADCLSVESSNRSLTNAAVDDGK